MKAQGHLDLNQNQLQRAALQVENNFPDTPVVGRIVFKDKIVYICVDIGNNIPVWVPLTQEISTYVHNQSTVAAQWTITHGINANTPSVQVYDTNSKMVIPSEVRIADNNTVVIDFGTATAGRAVIQQGNEDGGAKPNYAFEYTQTNPSTTWVIQHNLGYNPIIRVFIGNQEVQPASITHDSVNQATITFTTVQVGTARCI